MERDGGFDAGGPPGGANFEYVRGYKDNQLEGLQGGHEPPPPLSLPVAPCSPPCAPATGGAVATGDESPASCDQDAATPRLDAPGAPRFPALKIKQWVRGTGNSLIKLWSHLSSAPLRVMWTRALEYPLLKSVWSLLSLCLGQILNSEG